MWLKNVGQINCCQRLKKFAQSQIKAQSGHTDEIRHAEKSETKRRII